MFQGTERSAAPQKQRSADGFIYARMPIRSDIWNSAEYGSQQPYLTLKVARETDY